VAEALFYILAASTLACGMGVVTARMPLFSVLSLLGSLFCLSAIYLLSGFQFIAATQVLVYAGAIMVLFIFVIMLLNLGDEAELQGHLGFSLSGKKGTIAGATALSLGLIGVIGAGYGTPFVANPAYEGGIDDLNALATVLFSRYALPFEAASLLLLATMIGVITLAKRQRTTDAGAHPQSAPPSTDRETAA